MNNFEKTKKSLSDRSIISDSVLPFNQCPVSFNQILPKITKKTIPFKKSLAKKMPIRIKRFIKYEPKMARVMPPEYLKKFIIIKRKVRSPILFRNRLKKHLRIKRLVKRLYPNMARKMCPQSLKKFIIIKKKLRVPIKFRKRRFRIISSRPPIMSMPSPGKPKSFSFTNQFQEGQYKKSLSPFKKFVKWDLKDDILAKVREQHA